MARCGNCGKKLGCSCKIRKATDGKSCCASCVTTYNNTLKQAQTTKKAALPGRTTTNVVPATAPSVIINVTAEQTE